MDEVRQRTALFFRKPIDTQHSWLQTSSSFHVVLFHERETWLLKSGEPVKSSTVVLLVLLALGVLFLLTRRKEASGQKFGSTDEFIQFMAAGAVKDAAEKDRINLDYSVDSIKVVEGILGRLHALYVKDCASRKSRNV